MSARTRWAGAAVVLLGATAIGAALVLTHRGHGPSSVTIQVGGRSASVAAGETLGDAVDAFALHPSSGRLLDVNGHVIRSNAFPGSIQVDGGPAAAGSVLRDGDRISVVDGHDRTETLSRSTVRLRDGIPGDPQFTIARAPGEELIVRGSVSHELVSTRFRALGTARSERAVALTFDDGPSPVYTPRILRALRRLHVHATFFVIGYLAQAYPAIVREEQRLGMAVGNHTYNHPEVPPFAQLPRVLMRDEISLTAGVLERLGVHTDLFRPPAGSTSPTVERVASTFGERVVLWSVDPADWAPGATARTIAARVLSAVHPGSIVVLHDGGGDRSATLAALPLIVHGIRHRHLRLVTLDARPLSTRTG
jgi:peptidoglycan/xylan/chitin deacetylase (PgdA/CDA1 family)/sulfur carrier protein ThiS